MKTKILKYEIFNESMDDLFKYINGSEKLNIISGNPEVLYSALFNPELLNSFTGRNSLIIPDGVGVVLASRMVGNGVKEKIAGIEVMNRLLKTCESENKGVYLLGAKQEIVDLCAANIVAKYPALRIVGKHDGYFDIDNCQDLLRDITEKKPYVLFVAMGCPRQEKFIAKYMELLPCSIFMGVGGSFDVFAGKVKRAPDWMIGLGLEWLYRVAKEPYRIKRLGSIPKFLFIVLKDKFLTSKTVQK